MKIKPFYGFLGLGLAIVALSVLSILQFGPQPNNFKADDVLSFRMLKNRLLKSQVGSPFYGNMSFDSLFYFTPTPSEVYLTDFYPSPTANNLDLMPDRPGYDSHQQVGYVILKKETWTDTLFVLKDLSEKSDTSYFIPFSDLSNGKGSYGGGRYLDVTLKKGQPVKLDFNYSYNPYCAYNADFICARIPAINQLSRSIEAGEKEYAELPPHETP